MANLEEFWESLPQCLRGETSEEFLRRQEAGLRYGRRPGHAGPGREFPPDAEVLRFLRSRNEDKIIELDERGRRRDPLRYPNGRNYYRVGDVILVNEVELDVAQQIFPELRSQNEADGPSLLEVGLALLGEPPEKVRVAHRITEIVPDGQGGGACSTIGLVVLDSVVVEMQNGGRWSRGQLAEQFNYSRVAGQLQEYQPWIEALAEFAGAAATGAVRAATATATAAAGAAGRRFVRYLVLRQARRYARNTVRRRLLRALTSHLAGQLVSAAEAFVRDFVDFHFQYHRRMEAHRRRQELAQASVQPDFEMFSDAELARRALRSGVAAAAAALVTGLLSAGVDAAWQSHVRSLDQDTRLRNEIRLWFQQQLFEKLTAGFQQSLADAVARAARQQQEQRGASFGALLRNELSQLCLVQGLQPGNRRETFEGILTSVIEAARDGLLGLVDRGDLAADGD